MAVGWAPYFAQVDYGLVSQRIIDLYPDEDENAGEAATMSASQFEKSITPEQASEFHVAYSEL
jgi:hypothetical protein